MEFGDLLLVAGPREGDSWELNPAKRYSLFRSVLLLCLLILPFQFGFDMLHGHYKAAIWEVVTMIAFAITIKVHYDKEKQYAEYVAAMKRRASRHGKS